MNSNSLNAFGTKIKPVLSRRQQEVYDVIQEMGKATMRDVARVLGRERSSISGRFTELFALNYIYVCEQRDEFGSDCGVYAIKPPEEVFPVIKDPTMEERRLKTLAYLKAPDVPEEKKDTLPILEYVK